MSNVMKQKLMLALVSLTLLIALAGFLMMNQSLAWFSNNKTVSANGLSVSAQSTPNLIIGTEPSEIQGSREQFSVSFENEGGTDMIAVTRDGSVEDAFLKYLVNHHAVDNSTGLENGTEALDFAAVPTDGEGTYFVDFTVYIASTLKPLEVSSLDVSIVSPTSLATELNYLKAASIDLYLNEISNEGYCGTISVANKNTVDLFAGHGGEIPLNTNGYLTVIMRCYFDGALTYMDGTTERAYINSYNVKTTGINLGVHFAATEAAEETN